MPRRTLRLIDSLLKFKFKHKFILGDRCSPWRHRRGRRLLNLSFILFLLPCIKPHQPGCYQDLIKTNFNKKATESINSTPPPRLSHLAYWLERPSPLTFSLSSSPPVLLGYCTSIGQKLADQFKRQKTQISFYFCILKKFNSQILSSRHVIFPFLLFLFRFGPEDIACSSLFSR